MSLKTALLSLQALLSSPEPDDPQDAVVASVYKKDHNEFVRTAKYWTETYAKVRPSARSSTRSGATHWACGR